MPCLIKSILPRLFFPMWLVCCLVPSSAHSATMLSLQAQGGPDLGNLSVGQLLTFEVNISGVSSDIDYLAATVSFPGGILGSSSNILPGSIVTDETGFWGTPLLGGADGNYDSLFAVSTLPISSDGTFFTFDLTVQSPGVGSITFDFYDARDQAGGVVDLIIGDPLAFTVASGPFVVPEPASWMVCSLFGLVCSVVYRSRPRFPMYWAPPSN